MTLVDLNPMEIVFLVKVLELQKRIMKDKDDNKKDSRFPNAINEIQSIIYKLEKALTKK